MKESKGSCQHNVNQSPRNTMDEVEYMEKLYQICHLMK